MEFQYEKKKNFIINAIYVLIVILIAYAVLKYALGLLSPFIFAFGIAYLLKKPSNFISTILRLPLKLTSVLLVIIFYSTMGVLISLLGVKLISVITGIVSEIPIIYESQFEPFLTATFDGIEQTVYRLDPALVEALNKGFDQFLRSLGDNITSISLNLLRAISGIASSLPAFLIKVLLMIISTFFIAGDYNALSKFMMRQFTNRGREIIQTIKQYMINTLFVVFRSYALIMSITFVELSIGLSVIGIPNAILLAMTIACFDILPVLGTGGIMIPWIFIAFLQGNYKIAIGLLVIYAAVTIIRNILEPKIIGGQLGLHPVVTLMSIFIGAKLFGVVGLFGLPITMSLLRHLNDTGTIKLFK